MKNATRTTRATRAAAAVDAAAVDAAAVDAAAVDAAAVDAAAVDAAAVDAAAVDAAAADAAAVDAAAVDAAAVLPTDTPALQAMVSQLLAQLASKQATTTRSTGNVSCKQHIINLLSVDGASMSIDELAQATGKTAVNIRTQLSDLKSARYCGSYGVQPIVSTRANNITRYQFSK